MYKALRAVYNLEKPGKSVMMPADDRHFETMAEDVTVQSTETPLETNNDKASKAARETTSQKAVFEDLSSEVMARNAQRLHKLGIAPIIQDAGGDGGARVMPKVIRAVMRDHLAKYGLGIVAEIALNPEEASKTRLGAVEILARYGVGTTASTQDGEGTEMPSGIILMPPMDPPPTPPAIAATATIVAENPVAESRMDEAATKLRERLEAEREPWGEVPSAPPDLGSRESLDEV